MSASHDDGGGALALERILFFSDAVFAIAITLLVIEIKVPEIEHHADSRALGLALVQLTPRFIGFVTSFFLIGQVWIEHHRMGRVIRRYDTGLLWCNLLLLFFVAFMPFASGLLSEYIMSPVAMAFYATAFMGLGLAKALFFRHGMKNGLVDIDAADTGRIRRRIWATPLTAAAVAVAGALGVPFAVVGFGLIPVVARLMDRTTSNSKAVRATAQ